MYISKTYYVVVLVIPVRPNNYDVVVVMKSSGRKYQRGRGPTLAVSQAAPRNVYDDADEEEDEEQGVRERSDVVASNAGHAKAICLVLVSTVLLIGVIAGLFIYTRKSDQSIQDTVTSIHHRVSRLDLASDNVTVIEGPVGPPGANGTVGPQGPQGEVGPAGAVGPTGPAGPQGEVGPQGPAGTDGATGPVGPQGPAGLNGTDGAVGPQGPTGATGPAGLNGTDGAVGPQGPIGPTGPAGADGAVGPMGPAGTNGTDGAVGATGPAGPQGPAGLNGTDGAVGPTGPAGADGAVGPTGATGPTCGVSCTAFTVDAGGGTSYALLSTTDKFQLVRLPGDVVVWESTPSLSAWINGSATVTGTVTASAVAGGTMTGSSLNVGSGSVTAGALSATSGTFSSTLGVTGVATFASNVTIGGGVANARLQLRGGGIALEEPTWTNSSLRPLASATIAPYEIRGHSSSASDKFGFLRLSAGTGPINQASVDISGFNIWGNMENNVAIITAGTKRFDVNDYGTNVYGPLAGTSATFSSTMQVSGTAFVTGAVSAGGNGATGSASLQVWGGVAIGRAVTLASTRPALSATVGAGEIRAHANSGFSNDNGFLRLSAGGGTSTSAQSTIELSGASNVADMDRNIVMRTNGTERLRIDSNGTVTAGSVSFTSVAGGVMTGTSLSVGAVSGTTGTFSSSLSATAITGTSLSAGSGAVTGGAATFTSVTSTGPVVVESTRATIELKDSSIVARGRVFQAVAQNGSRVDVSSNLYYNGSSWMRDDNTTAGVVATVSPTGFQVHATLAGNNPATLTNTLTATPAGLVGIGTATPVVALEVSNPTPGSGSGGIVQCTNPGSAPLGSSITLTTPGGDPGMVLIRGNGAGGVLRRYDFKVNSGQSLVIRDDTAGADRLTLSSTGTLTTGPISVAGTAVGTNTVIEFAVSGVTAKSRIFPAAVAAGNRIDMGSNLYYNGTHWMRDDTSTLATTFYLGGSGLQYRYAAAGANPATLVSAFRIDPTGNMQFGATASAYDSYPYSFYSSVNNRIAAFVQTLTGDANIEITRTAGTISSWQWWIPSGSTNLQLWSGNSGSTGTRFTVTAAGSVGIGTTVPETRLHVSASAMSTSIETEHLVRFWRPSTGGVREAVSAGIRVGSFETGISGRGRMDFVVSGAPGAGNNWAFTPDVTVMTLNGNGYVGVNFQAPDHQFVVNGPALGSSANAVSPIASFRQTDGSNNAILQVQSFRRSAGPGHSTEETRIRRRIDVTDMGFFALGSNYAKISGNGGDGFWVSSGENLCVGSLSISCQNRVDIGNGGLRVQGDVVGGTGAGMELGYDAFENSYINSYRRSATAGWKWFLLRGSGIQIHAQTSTTDIGTAAGNTNWVGLTVNGVVQVWTNTGQMIPRASNVISLGGPSNLWSVVYSNTGTINQSDRRRKQNITDTTMGLRFIRKLRPVSYVFRPETRNVTQKVPLNDSLPANHPEQRHKEVNTTETIVSKRRHEGLIAQEVFEAMTELNISTNDFAGYIDPSATNQTGYLGLRYEEFIGPLIKAVQEIDQVVTRWQPVEGAPLSSTAPCQPGEQRFTTEYLFTCVRANQWGRSLLELSW